jgi:ABC-2 type transport system permease protein
MSLSLYFVLFIALSVIMSSISVMTYSPDFSEMKPKFTVINRDGSSPLANGIATYLGKRAEEDVLEDRKDALQDATFYHATDYIIILPPGFREGFFSGSPMKAETVMTTESASGYYADSLVDQYLNLTRLYMAANPDTDEQTLADTVLADLSMRVAVEKKQFGESEPVNANYHVYARMMPYMTMVLVILCVSNIMLAFRRPDVNMRNLCAPIKPRSMGLQQILCYSLMSFAAFFALNVTGIVQYGSKLSGTDGGIIALIILNSFVFTVVATAIASLACLFVRGPNSQNAVANSLSLVLSFIGGVFVPLELLGDGLLAVSRFTPTYWYVTALDRICALTSFGGDALATVWQAVLIQLAFAAAIFCVALAVNKHRSGSEKFFGSASTELEA